MSKIAKAQDIKDKLKDNQWIMFGVVVHLII